MENYGGRGGGVGRGRGMNYQLGVKNAAPTCRSSHSVGLRVMFGEGGVEVKDGVGEK